MEESTDRSNAQITPGGEWLRFGVMAVILIGTILVIMLLRPMIFGRIVPAIMGEGMLTAPIPTNIDGESVKTDTETTPAEVAPPPTTAAEEAAPATDDPASQQFIPIQAGGDDNGYPAAKDTGTPATDATTPTTEAAATAVSALRHTVQPGENLTAIAQKYNITIDDIIRANALTNPNQITAGTELVIPQP